MGKIGDSICVVHHLNIKTCQWVDEYGRPMSVLPLLRTDHSTSLLPYSCSSLSKWLQFVGWRSTQALKCRTSYPSSSLSFQSLKPYILNAQGPAALLTKRGKLSFSWKLNVHTHRIIFFSTYTVCIEGKEPLIDVRRKIWWTAFRTRFQNPLSICYKINKSINQ